MNRSRFSVEKFQWSLLTAFLISDTPVIPMVDLGFAISATATKAKEHFTKMRAVIKMFFDKYGFHRVAYSVLTFGSSPTIRLTFNSPRSAESSSLARYVDSIPQNPGTGNLDKALRGARDLFKASNGARPNALKVLVVITDKKSNSTAQGVKNSADILDDMGIRVIGVALGNEGDGELNHVTDVSDDVINTTASTSPAKIVEEVMDRILDSKSVIFLSHLICKKIFFHHCTERDGTC